MRGDRAFRTEDEELVDRKNAVEYFDVLRSALRNADTRHAVREELTLILTLCNTVGGMARDVNDLEIDALLQPDEEDSQLAAELRKTVMRIRNVARRQQQRRMQKQEQTHRQRRLDSFFRR